MKKLIRNTWQTVTTSSLAGRLLVVLIVLVVLAAAMILSGPKPPGDFDPLFRPTPLPVIEGTTTAAQPPAILSSEYKLTNGVVLAVVSILVIVILGTLLFIRRYNRKTRG